MKNKNLLNLSKSLPCKLLLTLALIIGWGSSAWAQKTLPYSYGFENSLSDEGWTSKDLATGSLSSEIISSSTSYPAHSGSYLFKFYASSSSTQYIISPELSNSATGIDVYVYYNCMTTYGSGTRTFYIGYSTTDNSVESFSWSDITVDVTTDKAWYKSPITSCPTGTKYVAIKYTLNYTTYFDDITIEEQEQYKAPSSLTVNSFTSSSATLSWTDGRDETAWQIAYSTKENFDPDTEGVKVSVDSNPYTLTDLVEGVSYYAYVRANYDGNYSSWSNYVEFSTITELTLNDNTNTSTYAPVHNSTQYGIKSQMIFPASSLESISGRKITKLTFYGYGSSSSITDLEWTNATFDVYINEIDNVSYYSSSTVTLKDWGTKVAEGITLSLSGGKLEISLSSGYTYNGNDLIVGIQQTTNTSSAVTSTWYGLTESSNYASAYTYSYSGSNYFNGSAKFSPKMTITTAVSPTVSVTLGDNGYTTFASPRPLDLTAANLPTGLKAYKAAVNGTTVNFTEINQAVPANTGILLEGTAGQTYAIPVADSGTTPEGNAFEVNSTGGTFAAESGYTCYGLKKNSAPLVFATFDPATVAIPTNKAYLKVSNTSPARELTCTFDDVTGISTVNHDAKANGQYFNLAGQRVAQPVKGLYIVNGRKVVMK